MTTSFNPQLIFAIAIIIFAVAVFGWLVWSKIALLLSPGFRGRAPWIVVGAAAVGVALYYMKR